jgi:uncharacterized membrane protein
MSKQRTPFFRMAAAMLAVLGLLDASYLALERMIGDTSGFCPTGGGCTTVQSSAYSALFGIPLAYIGVAGYLTMLALALLALSAERLAGLRVTALLLALAGLGVLFSLYLSYLQVAVIGAICFWCVVSALIELSIWTLALLDWRAERAQETIQPARA